MALIKTKNEEHQTTELIKLINEIENLREIGNSLFECTSVEAIFKKVVRIISEKINPQVISLFLISKDGVLERKEIKIFSVDEEKSDDWLANEHYKPGEGFSGKAITDCGQNVYGQVYSSDDITKEFELRYGEEYINKLGLLKCGISVPLNGTHKTFGTIEVLNKVDPELGTPSETLTFSKFDIYWLTILGAHIANAISRIRRTSKDIIISKINFELANFSSKFFSIEEIREKYENIAQKLITEYLPYKVCIIRLMINDSDFFEVVGKDKTKDITWVGRKDIPRTKRDGIVGRVLQTGKKKIVTINKDNISNFLSKDWIENQKQESGEYKLKTYICYPIKMGDTILGAMSFFIGYEYNPVDTDWTFLENISFQIAAFHAVDRLHSMKNKDSYQENKFLDKNSLKVVEKNKGFDSPSEDKQVNETKSETKTISDEFSLESIINDPVESFINDPERFRKNAKSPKEFAEITLKFDRALEKRREKRLFREEKETN